MDARAMHETIRGVSDSAADRTATKGYVAQRTNVGVQGLLREGLSLCRCLAVQHAVPRSYVVAALGLS